MYDAYRDAEFDWVLLSHHTHTMTGDPHGGSGDIYGAYQWWTNPASSSLLYFSSAVLADPDPDGLPDYTDPGNAVSPGWNEALSFSSAAEAANDPEGGFVAFAGREYATGPNEAVVCPAPGGHPAIQRPTQAGTRSS